MPNLPLPDSAAAAHSAALEELIATRLAGTGWLSFADYMQLALYAPGLGYYSAGAHKFGAAGDFVTAAELSPLFAAVCARQMSRLFAACGAASVLELGPGSGRFAATALEAFHRAGISLSRYALLEVSADLRERQQRLLKPKSADAEFADPEFADPGLAGNVPLAWLNELPQRFRGVIFGNEVIDALPCERFVVQGGRLWRLGVGVARADSERRFEWRARPADGSAEGDDEFNATATGLLRDLQAVGVELPDGYCGEWQLGLVAWIASLAQSLECGAILLADYGLPRRQLYHPDRVSGSLRCHYRHHAHADPFSLPGLTDITAWVDFTRVAEAAAAAGLEVAGFTTQGGFLLGGGIEQVYAELRSADSADELRTAQLASGLRRLLLPGEMGEAVKFILLTRDIDVSLPAFELRDLRASL